MCEARGWSVYVYGATDETLEKLQTNLKAKFPDLKIAGSHAPPFRPLSDEEDAAITSEINASGARVVLVGIGMPKQERWMEKHKDRLPSSVFR